MITKSTVLILGAGASAPYGFPTGRNLLFDITEGLFKTATSTGALYLPMSRLFEAEHIARFRETLLTSNQASVDAFLESWPTEEFTEIGKTAIAIKLIGSEKLALLERKREPAWYEYLWNQLGTTKQDVLHNKLSVITFNYDRSLEYTLFHSLENSYNLSADDAAKYLRNIPIIHVYGQLGLPDFFDKENGRAYTPDLDGGNLERAVSGIELVRGSQGVSPELAESIDKALSNAEAVCFLGFGYHIDNLKRLKLQSFKRNLFLGSGYGLANGERREVTAFFDGLSKKINLGLSVFNVLSFIRENSVFE